MARFVAAKRGRTPGTVPAKALRQCGQNPRPTAQCTVRNLGGGMSRTQRLSGATRTSGLPQPGQTGGAGASRASSASSGATRLRPCPSCPGFAPPCRMRAASSLSFLKFTFEGGVFSSNGISLALRTSIFRRDSRCDIRDLRRTTSSSSSAIRPMAPRCFGQRQPVDWRSVRIHLRAE